MGREQAIRGCRPLAWTGPGRGASDQITVVSEDPSEENTDQVGWPRGRVVTCRQEENITLCTQHLFQGS